MKVLVILALLVAIAHATTLASVKNSIAHSKSRGSGSGECEDCTQETLEEDRNSEFLGPHGKVVSEDCDEDCRDRHYRHTDDARYKQWIEGDIDEVGDLEIDSDGTKHFVNAASEDGDDDDDDSFIQVTSFMTQSMHAHNAANAAQRQAHRAENHYHAALIQKVSVENDASASVSAKSMAVLEAKDALMMAHRARKIADRALADARAAAKDDDEDGECKDCTQKVIEADHADTTNIIDHAHDVDSTDCDDCGDTNYDNANNVNQAQWTVSDIDTVGDLTIAEDGTKTFLNPIDDDESDESDDA